MPTSTTSASLRCAAYHCWRAGSSFLHGSHQEFQKLRITVLPARSAEVTFAPEKSVSVNGGAGFPSSRLVLESARGSVLTFTASTTANAATAIPTQSAIQRNGCFTRVPRLR